MTWQLLAFGAAFAAFVYGAIRDAQPRGEDSAGGEPATERMWEDVTP